MCMHPCVTCTSPRTLSHLHVCLRLGALEQQCGRAAMGERMRESSDRNSRYIAFVTKFRCISVAHTRIDTRKKRCTHIKRARVHMLEA